ncbi:DUF2905 domain-containing protein [Bacillus taeanensis]|uniref:DUF2905 domain-containing protein n=1 Tax=Bacillus taeanensis TaxID=273032 RepID=A0A366XVK6_9BACI|nr:DUF2905 domain-containing protein [Bacillus taeanensis]RBW70420.1 DUF2905 domain-containing protein [Bacillus taeanensis]
MGVSKMFIVLGITFLVIGLVWQFIEKLPGDIVFKKGNTTFYFPIVTSIVISIVLSLVFYFIGKFK